MARTLAAAFSDRQAAQRAVVDLQAAGFDATRITMSGGARQSARAPSRRRGLNSTLGAVVGALVLGTGGALIGWAADVSLLNPPGDRALLVVFLAIVGGMVGWLAGGLALTSLPIFSTEPAGQRDDAEAVVLSVQAGGRQTVARHILVRNGGRELQSRHRMLPASPWRDRAAPMKDRTPAAS